MVVWYGNEIRSDVCKMSIEIKYVKDAGNKGKERIVLKASTNDDVGRYILFDTTYLEEGIVSNHVRHSFWFPDKEVAEGDLIVVYTRDGTSKSVENKNGTISHFLYMGIDKTIWNKTSNCAVLIEVKSWDFKKIV